jgi:hypothetical protein
MPAAATAPAQVPDIERIDRAVEEAIHLGDPALLRVLGYGEITLVFGWPRERPELAVKRLPPFRDRGQLDRYAELLSGYTGALGERSVRVVPTDLHAVDPSGPRPRAYLVQPLVPGERHLNVLLRDPAAPAGGELLERLVDTVATVVDSRIGLDAQASNWAVEDGSLACFDISTPLMRDAEGRHGLDLALFLSVYPWALRRALVPVAHGVMDQYHDPRTVLVDVGSNLVKERLDSWLPAFLAAAERRVSPPITEREVRRYFARDKKLWLLMQWLRRADRAWQRGIRRRAYPFLLPPPYHYGPQELHESEAR